MSLVFAVAAALTGVISGGAVAVVYRAWKRQHSGPEATRLVRREKQWRDD